MRPCPVCKRTSFEDLVHCDFCGSELDPKPRSAPPPVAQPPKPPGPCQHRDIDPGADHCHECGYKLVHRKPR